MDVSLAGESEVGLFRKPNARIWLRRFFAIKESLAPEIAGPACPNFVGSTKRCVRSLRLPEVLESAMLFWRSECRAPQRRVRAAGLSVASLAQECEHAVISCPSR